MTVQLAATGYLAPDYAASLAEFGHPRHLPLSDGWVLERSVPGAPDRDAMGPYPLFACRDWSRLHLDLETVGEDLVSLVLVADPFGGFTAADLERCFPDRLVLFKDHFVVQLGAQDPASLPKHHRRNVKQALRRVEVEIVTEPTGLTDKWTGLYANLVRRHGITGLPAFSPTALARQLRVPGLTAFRARQGPRTVGMVLFYEQDEIVYYHLGAYTDEGYAGRASYAIFSRAIEHFADQRLKWLDLGAGTGRRANSDDGLTRFKRGWATGVRPAYLCGRIFDLSRYAALVSGTGAEATTYFPAYRQGEFS